MAAVDDTHLSKTKKYEWLFSKKLFISFAVLFMAASAIIMLVVRCTLDDNCVKDNALLRTGTWIYFVVVVMADVIFLGGVLLYYNCKTVPIQQ